jgi:hypothetical protein
MNSSFLAIGSPDEYKKLLGSRFLIFCFFSDFWANLSQKFEKSRFFHYKMAQKFKKKEKIKNPLPSNFSYSPGLIIAKKLEFRDQTSKTS